MPFITYAFIGKYRKYHHRSERFTPGHEKTNDGFMKSQGLLESLPRGPVVAVRIQLVTDAQVIAEIDGENRQLAFYRIPIFIVIDVNLTKTNVVC